MTTPRAVIPAADAQQLAREQNLDLAALMTSLLGEAATFARPPVSNFRVGVVARGTTTGNLYLGANVEFAHEALSFTVHAEQSSITNAWMHREEGIDLLAVNAPPCGYCRQFLNELTTASQLTIAMPNTTMPLTALLPNAFGPRDLGIDGGLLQRENHHLAILDEDDLAEAALNAANRSYAPYSKAFAGVALRTNDGAIVSGAYAENAAFNPSMSPLEVALSMLNLSGRAWSDIAEAVLVQSAEMHTNATKTVLAAISKAPLRVIAATHASGAASS
ncbi:MAG: cytidine deaminase [Thermoanaerobaculia bacterium]